MLAGGIATAGMLGKKAYDKFSTPSVEDEYRTGMADTVGGLPQEERLRLFDIALRGMDEDVYGGRQQKVRKVQDNLKMFGATDEEMNTARANYYSGGNSGVKY